MTINGTKTNYTTVRKVADNLTIESQYINFIQNGKPLEDQPMRKLRRVNKE